MAYAEKTIVVQKPISEVFQFILDGENNTLWRPTIKDIKRAEEGPVKVGTVFIQGMNGPNGMRISADYEITEIEVNKKMTFKVLNGPFLPVGEFKFEEEEAGTKLTFSMSESLSDSARDQHMQNVVGALENLKVYYDSLK